MVQNYEQQFQNVLFGGNQAFEMWVYLNFLQMVALETLMSDYANYKSRHVSEHIKMFILA